MAEYVRAAHKSGKIADPANLASLPAWLMTGQRDTVVHPPVVHAAAEISGGRQAAYTAPTSLTLPNPRRRLT